MTIEVELALNLLIFLLSASLIVVIALAYALAHSRADETYLLEQCKRCAHEFEQERARWAKEIAYERERATRQEERADRAIDAISVRTGGPTISDLWRPKESQQDKLDLGEFDMDTVEYEAEEAVQE